MVFRLCLSLMVVWWWMALNEFMLLPNGNRLKTECDWISSELLQSALWEQTQVITTQNYSWTVLVTWLQGEERDRVSIRLRFTIFISTV